MPSGSQAEYVVIDRPLAEKVRDAGWRAEVKIGDKSLVETHHERFQSCLKDILKGDGLPQVRVRDERTKEKIWTDCYMGFEHVSVVPMKDAA